MTTISQIQARVLDSGLVEGPMLEAEIAAWETSQPNHPDDAAALLAWLVERGKLSRFHADALAAGHVGPFHLGPYEVHQQLVSGDGGSIYRARHVEFNQPVSLKVFALPAEADPAAEQRIGREMRIAVALDHPNVVRTFQAGKIGEIHYLALEDLRGETLGVRLAREGKLPYDEACQIVRDAARGLAHLHENDIDHRDISPDSIWLTEEGTAKLMEFGAASDALEFLDVDEDVLSEEPHLRGHHHADPDVNDLDYLPPEQLYDPARADSRSDVYSLGCTFYHCLSGAPPFHDKNPLRQVLKHVFESPAAVSTLSKEIPHQLDQTLAGMLAKQPEDRFQTAQDVAWALDQYLIDDAPQEEIHIIAVSPQYLEWAQMQHPAEHPAIAVGDVAATPELAGFLHWMTHRTRRRRKPRPA